MPPIKNTFGKKQKINKNTVKRLFDIIMSKHKIWLLVVFICIIVSGIASVSGQLFLQSLIDDYISPLLLEENPVFTNLLKALFGIGFVYLIGVVSTFISNRLLVNISQGVLKDIRNQMFSHMQTLPISYFDNNTHGDIMSHYTNDTDTLMQMISQSLPNLVSSIITIIAVLFGMLHLSIILTLIVIIGVIVMLIVSKNVASKAGKYFVEQQDSLGKLNGYIEEMIDGVKVVKVFTHEEIAKKDFDKVNSLLCENATKANIHANTLMPIMHNIGNVVYVIIAIVGGLLAINNKGLTLGAIASFLSLSKSFMNPIGMMAGQVNSIIVALAGASRIFSLMDEKSEENDGKIKLVYATLKDNELVESNNYTGCWAWKLSNKELIELKGDVRFNDVTFGYNSDKMVLKDINLYAKPGQKIAFVGATGAGKTTITNLINRFYDVNEGSITYDGINIKDINKKDLRKSLGIVLQDTNLFTGTIMENVKYGNHKATFEEVINAAKLANADSFINLLPDGYNTVLKGNGSNLSQGQRQLLAIARSALLNPPVMILDEATSSIDTRTEKIVQDGMDKLMENRTVFVIAHRLSTVRNSKAIMVLENGKIIERGEHEQLLEQKGKYYELYTGAFELE
ncbi:aBC transporter permease/ATP-binding protein [Acholeplasma sp. CAG:878]|nr:aBC transporter permease/ATP-binding protein [Acholeplasma sp. CAG:878]